MYTRLRTDAYSIEFEGAPAFWNEVIRPVIGGPEAPPDPEPEPEPVRPPAPRPSAATNAPAPVDFASAYRPAGREPRRGPDRPREFRRPPDRDRPPQQREERRQRPAPAELLSATERSSDPRTLYASLSRVEGRRGEKDAVLAAVWFLCQGDPGNDATPDEVDRHLRDHAPSLDVRVKPALQKHVKRTRMCEPGERHAAVRLSPKGANYVRTRLLSDADSDAG